MPEILEEIKYLKVRGRGHVPNLRGASPVSRDRGGRSYGARTVGEGEPNRRRGARRGTRGWSTNETRGLALQVMRANKRSARLAHVHETEGVSERPDRRMDEHQSTKAAQDMRGARQGASSERKGARGAPRGTLRAPGTHVDQRGAPGCADHAQVGCGDCLGVRGTHSGRPGCTMVHTRR